MILSLSCHTWGSDHACGRCWRVEYADRRRVARWSVCRRGTRVYSPAHAQDRHTSMKTSNRSHRTLLFSDKTAVERDRFMLYFLHGLLRTPDTHEEWKQRQHFITQIIRMLYFKDPNKGHLPYTYTVIPRLTKIIRSGITFVSRNPR